MGRTGAIGLIEVKPTNMGEKLRSSYPEMNLRCPEIMKHLTIISTFCLDSCEGLVFSTLAGAFSESCKLYAFQANHLQPFIDSLDAGLNRAQFNSSDAPQSHPEPHPALLISPSRRGIRCQGMEHTVCTRPLLLQPHIPPLISASSPRAAPDARLQLPPHHPHSHSGWCRLQPSATCAGDTRPVPPPLTGRPTGDARAQFVPQQHPASLVPPCLWLVAGRESREKSVRLRVALAGHCMGISGMM